MPGRYDAITDVPGIRVGHWTDRRGGTGCTAIVCVAGALGAVDVRGGAPGSRELEVLASQNLVRTAHAVLLTGGSAYGLAAADGVMRWLEENGAGFESAFRRVPIVPTAVLYDLGVGRADVSPSAESGYLAARRARSGKLKQGSVGAGAGATVAKLMGREYAMKGGIGTASFLGPNGTVVGAIAACNAVGNVIDPSTGETVAGSRGLPGAFVSLAETLKSRTEAADALRANTTLVCIATNARLEHGQLQRLAIQAHDGLARAIFPAHTFADGDIAFALSTAQVAVEQHHLLDLGVLTVLAVEAAILRSVRLARGLLGVPSASDWRSTTATNIPDLS